MDWVKDGRVLFAIGLLLVVVALIVERQINRPDPKPITKDKPKSIKKNKEVDLKTEKQKYYENKFQEYEKYLSQEDLELGKLRAMVKDLKSWPVRAVPPAKFYELEEKAHKKLALALIQQAATE